MKKIAELAEEQELQALLSPICKDEVIDFHNILKLFGTVNYAIRCFENTALRHDVEEIEHLEQFETDDDWTDDQK